MPTPRDRTLPLIYDVPTQVNMYGDPLLWTDNRSSLFEFIK